MQATCTALLTQTRTRIDLRAGIPDPGSFAGFGKKRDSQALGPAGKGFAAPALGGTPVIVQTSTRRRFCQNIVPSPRSCPILR